MRHSGPRGSSLPPEKTRSSVICHSNFSTGSAVCTILSFAGRGANSNVSAQRGW
jgi:hypothetical protein